MVDPSSRPRRGLKNPLVQGAILLCLFVGLLVAFAFTQIHGSFGGDEPAERSTLSGAFQSSNPGDSAVGAWRITPSSCVDGTERGFVGLAFAFTHGPVKEIRLDTSRPGDQAIEIDFADPQRPVVGFRERECRNVTGSIRRSSYVLDRRHMFRLVGNVVIDCPQRGFTGRATFDGCLPQTAADLRR